MAEVRSKFLMEPLPFVQAIDFFEKKLPRKSNRYTDVWQAEHSHVFTVARTAGIDILDDIRTAMGDAIKNGTTFYDFQKTLIPTLDKKGWFQKLGIAGDKTKQARRLRVIYDTNLRTAFAAGAWTQAQQVQDDSNEKQFVEYTVWDNAPNRRPLHQTWEGMILPLDSSFWNHHYPPNGWGCKCKARHLSEVDIKLRKLKKTKINDPRIKRQTEKKIVRGVNNGKPIDVTMGIDPAFDYNIGKGYDKQMRIYGAQGWRKFDHQTAVNTINDIFENSPFKRFLKEGEYNGEYFPVGFMTDDLQKLTNAPHRLIYMSGRSAKKQREQHSHLENTDYVLVQQILDRGKIKMGVNPDTGNTEVVGFLILNDKQWKTSFKIVNDEVWFGTLHRLKKKQIKLETDTPEKEKITYEWIRE